MLFPEFQNSFKNAQVQRNRKPHQLHYLLPDKKGEGVHAYLRTAKRAIPFYLGQEREKDRK